MSLTLPKLKEVLSVLYTMDADKAYLVVSADGWEIVSDTTKGVSGYVSAWYDLTTDEDNNIAHIREVAESMLRDVKDDYASRLY
jgi:hypothetical protein